MNYLTKNSLSSKCYIFMTVRLSWCKRTLLLSFVNFENRWNIWIFEKENCFFRYSS